MAAKRGRFGPPTATVAADLSPFPVYLYRSLRALWAYPSFLPQA
jgi:hypothetical protein